MTWNLQITPYTYICRSESGDPDHLEEQFDDNQHNGNLVIPQQEANPTTGPDNSRQPTFIPFHGQLHNVIILSASQDSSAECCTPHCEQDPASIGQLHIMSL